MEVMKSWPDLNATPPCYPKKVDAATLAMHATANNAAIPRMRVQLYKEGELPALCVWRRRSRMLFAPYSGSSCGRRASLPEYMRLTAAVAQSSCWCRDFLVSQRDCGGTYNTRGPS